VTDYCSSIPGLAATVSGPSCDCDTACWISCRSPCSCSACSLLVDRTPARAEWCCSRLPQHV